MTIIMIKMLKVKWLFSLIVSYHCGINSFRFEDQEISAYCEIFKISDIELQYYVFHKHKKLHFFTDSKIIFAIIDLHVCCRLITTVE